MLYCQRLQGADEFFHPFRYALAHYDIWGGIGLETFGDDTEMVKSLPVESVRTAVDGGDTADQWILTGIHTINRVYPHIARRRTSDG